MKILLTLFVLLFSSSMVADDISDFEIEGMSVGDKLFDHFSKEEFEKAKERSTIFKQKDGKFNSLLFYNLPRYKIYDGVRTSWKPIDKNYVLIGITGFKYFQKDFQNCSKLKETIINDIEKMIGNNAYKKDTGKKISSYDKTGDSYFYDVQFIFDSGGKIRIVCINWSEKIEQTQNYWDTLEVMLQTKEFTKILSNNPY